MTFSSSSHTFREGEVLNSNENQRARVWREGRATQVAGAVHLYPKGELGKRVAKLETSK
jgi:hypothetical protein